MAGVYTGTDFRRGFDCWTGHLIFIIHKKIKYFLFLQVLKKYLRSIKS